MATIDDIRQWITANESFLSGMAALVALAGLILSPIGMAVRRTLKRNGTNARADADLAPGSAEPRQMTAQASRATTHA